MVRLMGAAVAAVALGLGLAVSPAQAVTANFNFAQITSNTQNVGGQLNVQVSDELTPGSISFTFTNNVGVPSSITDVYFEIAAGILLRNDSWPFGGL